MGIVVATTRVQLRSGTGTQDITTSALGGLTPKAARLVVTRAITDATQASHAALSIGFTDGTRHGVVHYYSEDALSSSEVSTNGRTDSIIYLENLAVGSADGIATFSAWITNGITINVSDAFVGQYLCEVTFFAGSDLSVYKGSLSLTNAIDTAHDVTAPGFEPDLVLTMNVSDASGLGFGFVHNNRASTLTQRAIVYRDRDGRPTTEVYAKIENSYGGCQPAGAYSVDGNCWLEFSAFDSSGFTVTTRNAAPGSSRIMHYIALRLGSSPLVAGKVWHYTTPTSTGDATDTGPGFQPQAVLYILSLCPAVDTYYSDANAGGIGFSTITSGAQYASSVSSQDGVTDSHTHSFTDDKSINIQLHDGSAGVEAAFTSFTSSGVQNNYTVVTNPGKIFIGLAIQAESGTPITDQQPAYLKGRASITDQQPAYLKGRDSTTDQQPAYLKGRDSTTDQQPAYLRGQASITDQQPAYLKGRDSTTDQQPAYLTGRLVATVDDIVLIVQDYISDIQPAYLKGRDSTTDQQPAYLKGRDSTTDQQPAYLRGQASTTAQQPAYLSGFMAAQVTDQQPAYLRGQDSVTDQQPAYLKGQASITAQQPAYLKGGIIVTDQQPAYLKGQASTTDQQPAYLKGRDSTTDQQPAYLRGQDSTTDQQPAYLKGRDSTTDQQPAYLRGQASTTDQQPAFLKGQASTTAQQPAYLKGGIIVTDQQPAYLKGQASITAQQPAYLNGFVAGQVIDQQPAYLRGQDSITDQQPAYLKGGIIVTDQQPAYLKGQASTTDQQPAYLKGRDSATDQQPAYLRGQASTTAQQPAYLFGVVAAQITDQQPAYLRGQASTTDQQPAYLRGQASTTDQQPAYLKGAGVITANQPAYLLGAGIPGAIILPIFSSEGIHSTIISGRTV